MGPVVSQNFDETFLAHGDLMAVTWGLVGTATGALIGHVTTPEPPDEVLYQAP